MRVYLSLKFYEPTLSFVEMNSSREGPVFGPLYSVKFFYNRIRVSFDKNKKDFGFCLDEKGCVNYEGRRYNEFIVFDESNEILVDENWRVRLEEYDARLNGSLG